MIDALAGLLTPLNVIYYAIAINFGAFAAFGFDKALAETEKRRIAESTLLTWAFLGGSPGAYAGRHVFRHKTRKQPFSSQLHMIAALHGVALCAAFVFWFYPSAVQAVHMTG
ncbi:MAG: DUF1294 domain-containing protein [Gammaproteobacteria bacterium]|nr:MAG: DUF1294 domain-containing protein [Gammaproteobacteria bacterium]